MNKVQIFLGTFISTYAVITAIMLRNSHFYTYFTLGTFLLFDWIDFKLTGNSILRYLLTKKNRKRLLLFLSISTILCFLVDYIYGVKLTKMWQWPAYEPIHFLRMYFIMNPTFVLGTYEIYQVIKYLLKPKFKDEISNKHIYNFVTDKILKTSGLPVGIFLLLTPLYILFVPTAPYIEFAMIFPFISVLLIPDTLTVFNGNKPFISELLSGNKLKLSAVLWTVLLLALFTEFINIFAQEWVYTRMPFMNLKVSSIPVSVFLGWIPLVAGTISIVNLVKTNK